MHKDNSTLLADSRKGLAHRLVAIGENRLELLAVELQEEANALVRALFLAFATVGCALLALMALSAAIVLAGWQWSPMGVLLILALVYALGAVMSYGLLHAVMNRWRAFEATLEQLKKDSQCWANFWS